MISCLVPCPSRAGQLFCDSLSSLLTMEAIMAWLRRGFRVTRYSVKKYVVRLIGEERRQLETPICKGKRLGAILGIL